MTTAAPAVHTDKSGDPVKLEALVAKNVFDSINTLTATQKDLVDVVATLKSKIDEISHIDVKKTVQQVEVLTDNVQKLSAQIRVRKDANYFAGIEDTKNNFSLLKAAIAVKHGDWSLAPQEHEILKAARAAREATIKAGHVTGIESSGSSVIPDQVIADEIAMIYAKGVLTNVAGDGTQRVRILDGLTGMAKIPRHHAGIDAFWIGEEDEYVESKLRHGLVSMNPRKLGVLISITDEMKRFATPAYDRMVRDAFIMAMAAKLDWTILYGTGTANMPLGVANMPANTWAMTDGYATRAAIAKIGVHRFYAENKTTTAPSGTAVGGELTFDDLEAMKLLVRNCDIEVNSSFATIAGHSYFTRLRQLKIENYSGQTSGQPYLLGMPMLTDDRLRAVIGNFQGTTKAKINKSLNSVAKFGDVFAGNWDNIVLGRWSGIEIVDDEGKGKGMTKDVNYVMAKMYCDVQALEERSMVHCPDARCLA